MWSRLQEWCERWLRYFVRADRCLARPAHIYVTGGRQYSSRMNPFRTPEPLRTLTSSNLSLKRAFPLRNSTTFVLMSAIIGQGF